MSRSVTCASRSVTCAPTPISVTVQAGSLVVPLAALPPPLSVHGWFSLAPLLMMYVLSLASLCWPLSAGHVCACLLCIFPRICAHTQASTAFKPGSACMQADRQKLIQLLTGYELAVTAHEGYAKVTHSLPTWFHRVLGCKAGLSTVSLITSFFTTPCVPLSLTAWIKVQSS